jgi:DNA-directed RNA polymerase specialized sigma24 family protein
MFTAHRHAVWAYCYRRLPRDDVQDAAAEVFLVAWRRVNQAPEGAETLVTWVRG